MTPFQAAITFLGIHGIAAVSHPHSIRIRLCFACCSHRIVSLLSLGPTVHDPMYATLDIFRQSPYTARLILDTI
jgi:hypothetical protein